MYYDKMFYKNCSWTLKITMISCSSEDFLCLRTQSAVGLWPFAYIALMLADGFPCSQIRTLLTCSTLFYWNILAQLSWSVPLLVHAISLPILYSLNEPFIRPYLLGERCIRIRSRCIQSSLLKVKVCRWETQAFLDWYQSLSWVNRFAAS